MKPDDSDVLLVWMALSLEREQEHKLNFLNLTITKATNKITSDIYRKPTTSNTIIPNDSYYPLEHKLAAIRYFASRINTFDLDHVKKETETDTVK